MFIDEKGKLFGKINLVDAVVLLFIVLALLGVVYRLYFTSRIIQPAVPESITYKATLAGVRRMSADALNVGDTVFLEPSNQLMGTITEKLVEPAKGNVVKTNGEVVESTMPGRYNVHMTINVETGTEPVESANIKNKLIVGNTMYLKTRMLLFSVTIDSVTSEKLQ